MPPTTDTPTAPRGSSGLAIASLVVGIISLFPCFWLLLGPIGLVLGIVSLVLAKKKQGPKGMALAGTILGGLATVLGIGAVVWGLLAGKPKPFAVPAPEYTSLVGEGYSGSGFHFTKEGKNFIGCSLHQFDDAAPATMTHPGFEAPITITGQSYVQDDVQILEYESAELDAITPLTYTGSQEAEIGHPVYLMLSEGAIKGHIHRYSIFEGSWFKTEKTFTIRGASGSAVVSGIDGSVMGVILGGEADAGDKSNEGYFEELKLP